MIHWLEEIEERPPRGCDVRIEREQPEEVVVANTVPGRPTKELG